MSNARFNVHAVGKVVYWVNRQRFYNTKGKQDGRSKAEAYCLDNFIDTRDIIKFDSDTETDYYEYLLDRQSRGEINGLSHHYLIRVLSSYTNANGDVIPEVIYNTDFVYNDLVEHKRVVVDVKSSEYFLTNDGGRFILLKSLFDKMFLSHGIYIKIILRDGKDGWREWHIGDKKKSQKLIKKQREQLKQLKAEKHAKEIEENKKQREIARMNELRATPYRTKAQQKRLDELEEKYSV